MRRLFWRSPRPDLALALDYVQHYLHLPLLPQILRKISPSVPSSPVLSRYPRHTQVPCGSYVGTPAQKISLLVGGKGFSKAAPILGMRWAWWGGPMVAVER
jgi:hypothetical protein